MIVCVHSMLTYMIAVAYLSGKDKVFKKSEEHIRKESKGKAKSKEDQGIDTMLELNYI